MSLTKVLIKTLVGVMNVLFKKKNQSAFIKGRFLLDGMLVVNEVLDYE